MILLVENKEEMRSTIERLEGYLERKELKLNAEKTKIMMFRKLEIGEKGLEMEDGMRDEEKR